MDESGPLALPSIDRVERLLAVLCGGIGTIFLILYLWIVFARLGYPFELEWMEGGTVLQVQRILDGLPLYSVPTTEFVPYIYTPFYYYVGAAVAVVVGNGFTAPRLVSFLASLAVLAFVFLLTRRRTDSAFAGY